MSFSVCFTAKEAFEKKVSPIIIDNTNLQAWEMKPYVALVCTINCYKSIIVGLKLLEDVNYINESQAHSPQAECNWAFSSLLQNKKNGNNFKNVSI